MNSNYNYVFFNTEGDVLKPLFLPLKSYDNIKVYDKAFKGNSFLQKLFFLHWSNKINKIIKLPFKKIWYKKMFSQSFTENRPCCYVFLGGKYISEDKNILKYVKKLNKNNKCVILCYDLIQKKNWDIDKIKNNCDSIVSYDIGEAERFGIDYFDMDIYGAITDITEPDTFKYDVFFLGFAKDRLKMLHDTYNLLSKNGLRCKFIICGSKPEEQINDEGILYCDPIPYSENLKYVNESKCLLEVCQGGSTAPTLRYREASVYKRKLLTNNSTLATDNQKNISVFNDISDIDINFIKGDIDYSSFNDTSAFSPYRLIEYLDNKFNFEEK